MKKIILVSIIILASVFNAHAQLKVNWDGKVSVSTTNTDFVPNLSVGQNPYYGGTSSVKKIALAAKPIAGSGYNIGVEGYVYPNQNYTSDINFGVLGIAQLNPNHGHNYGVSGMLNYSGSNSTMGGAAIYGADYLYLYHYPDNIQGAWAGYFHGGVHASGITSNGFYIPSDARLSENVEPIARNDRDGERTLDNLLRMNVLEYNLKNLTSERTPEEIGEMTEEVRASYEMMKKDEEKLATHLHFGLSAQDLQEIYPNLVMEGQDGYLTVNYIELVPLLIRSIQVLKQELDELKSEGRNLKKQPQTTDAFAVSSEGKSILYQNTPNPFRDKTVIRFKLSDEAKDASICIFDMTGKQLRKLPVSKGMESVSVNGYELGEGMFLYSLIVNGQEIDTKRMILSK